MTSADPGSFRDPLSQVFISDQQVLRGLSATGLAEYEAVEATGLLRSLIADGLVVGTEALGPDTHPLHDSWAGVLRHDRLPVISYPYEWTFEMLRDAALLQLEVTRRSVEQGCTTKDATSFNVAFDGTRPVFIDVGSFERIRPGEPWPGYQQFCQLFLNPLVLQAATGVDFHPWLRGAVDGLSSTDTAALVALRRRARRGLLVHLTAHARAERRYADTDADTDVRGELRQAGFGPKIVLAQLRNLDKTVRALRWKAQRSEWSEYSERSHYLGDDLPTKERFVAAAVNDVAPALTLDLGANDGRFSQLALANGSQRVVAADVDHLVVDKLYRHLRSTGEERILPLVLDLANPSGPTGWRSRERRAFTERVRPDLVLCLAVVHHLAFTDTVPLPEIVGFLADFDAPVVVEFPHPDDPMVRKLSARKRAGLFDHYNRPNWEAALTERFTVTEREDLPSGTRTLYRCTPRRP